MHVMARETWTDERLDDLTKHMDENFAELRAELRLQREEMGLMARQEDVDARFVAQQAHMNARFDALERTMQIGFTLIGAVLLGLIGLIGTQL
jgi:hypothetical protein